MSTALRMPKLCLSLLVDIIFLNFFHLLPHNLENQKLTSIFNGIITHRLHKFLNCNANVKCYINIYMVIKLSFILKRKFFL